MTTNMSELTPRSASRSDRERFGDLQIDRLGTHIAFGEC